MVAASVVTKSSHRGDSIRLSPLSYQFVTIYEDTTSSVELTAEALVKEAMHILMENAYAELFTILDANAVSFSPYTDIVDALEKQFCSAGATLTSTGEAEQVSTEPGLQQQQYGDEQTDDSFLLVRTHDRLFAANHLQKCFGESSLSVQVVQVKLDSNLGYFFYKNYFYMKLSAKRIMVNDRSLYLIVCNNLVLHNTVFSLALVFL